MISKPTFLRPFTTLSLIAVSSLANGEAEWKTLFNGKDLTGWKTILDNAPPGEDPKGYVTVKDGAIHMYKNTDPSEKVPFGVIQHEGTFSRFHLTFDYQWLEKKFAPRKDAIRDAGLLYHISGKEKVWPDSLEYQIQEGDTGDIVYLPKSGITWMHPDPKNAPEGQGDPGMLPEDGGTPRDFTGTDFAYIGRYPVHDTEKGWNRVDVIVHADETAEHLVNGKTRARIEGMRKKDGSPAKDGKIALQLEGAELLYRDVKIRELGEPLRADRTVASASSVKGQPTRKVEISIKNPSKTERPADLVVSGKDAAAFKATISSPKIPAGGSAMVTIEYTPDGPPSRSSAGLQIGSREEGVFVILQGVHLAAFEGKNEPPLQSIAAALGIPMNAGGSKLELDTKADTIGSSRNVRVFRAASAGKVKVTPLARFSPTGVVPFGFFEDGQVTPTEIGALADSGSAFPDAHQCLFPPLVSTSASVEVTAPEKPFSFFMKGHKYLSCTDRQRPTTATIAHTARTYPVHAFQGKRLENAWVVGFEEAENGDYQDSLFLLENVTPAE